MHHSQTSCRICPRIPEAKVSALFLNAQEAKVLQLVLNELGHPQPPTLIQIDNTTTVGIDRNCDVLPLLKFCTNKPILALLLRQLFFWGGGKGAFHPKKGCNAPSAGYSTDF
jgi:hypothetical protein